MSSLGIGAVRLLGCETAVTGAGQRTVRVLSRALRMPAYGTLVPLHGSHWQADGFKPAAPVQHGATVAAGALASPKYPDDGED
jgi:hypothetical protein